MSTAQQEQSSSSPSSSFGGFDADLAARLAAPVSPTTEKSAAEAQRRTSEWHPPTTTGTDTAPHRHHPAPGARPPQRTFSFDHEDHKHAMMAASGALSGGRGPGAPGDTAGFSERA